MATVKRDKKKQQPQEEVEPEPLDDSDVEVEELEDEEEDDDEDFDEDFEEDEEDDEQEIEEAGEGDEAGEVEPSQEMKHLEETWLNPDYTYRIMITSIQGFIAPTLTKVAEDMNQRMQAMCIFADEMEPAAFLAKHQISLVQRLVEFSSYDLLRVLSPSFETLEDFWTEFLNQQSSKVFHQFPLQFENSYDCLYRLLEDHDHFASHEELLIQWQRYELQQQQLQEEIQYYVKEREEQQQRLLMFTSAPYPNADPADSQGKADDDKDNEEAEKEDHPVELEPEPEDKPPLPALPILPATPTTMPVQRSLLYFTSYMHAKLKQGA